MKAHTLKTLSLPNGFRFQEFEKIRRIARRASVMENILNKIADKQYLN